MKTRIPPIPSDISSCLKKRNIVPSGDWSQEVLVEYLARLISNDELKIECADRLEKFWNEIRRGTL